MNKITPELKRLLLEYEHSKSNSVTLASKQYFNSLTEDEQVILIEIYPMLISYVLNQSENHHNAFLNSPVKRIVENVSLNNLSVDMAKKLIKKTLKVINSFKNETNDELLEILVKKSPLFVLQMKHSTDKLKQLAIKKNNNIFFKLSNNSNYINSLIENLNLEKVDRWKLKELLNGTQMSSSQLMQCYSRIKNTKLRKSYLANFWAQTLEAIEKNPKFKNNAQIILDQMNQTNK